MDPIQTIPNEPDHVIETTSTKKPIKKCEHGRVKRQCVDCGESAICIHRKRKTDCRECGSGARFCEHKRFKFSCKLCKGSDICSHGNRKSTCRDCKGSSICEHNTIKFNCSLCKPPSIFCIHGIRKYQCEPCNGSSICEHKVFKYRCRQCKGSSICEHNKEKAHCKACMGTSICIHSKERIDCKICLGSRLCQSEWCETTARKPYKYCSFCYVHLFPDEPIAHNYKTKERTVVDYILEKFPMYTWTTDRKIADGCSRRRPDIIADLGYQVIIIEVDENQHSGYDCSCENKRLMELSQDVGHRPIIFIRFNPDDYIQQDGTVVKTCWGINKTTAVCQIKPSKTLDWTNRLMALKEQVVYWCNPENKTDKTVEVVQLFYDET